MISYKDRCYCSSDCENHTCYRFFTAEDAVEAMKWWGGTNPPVAFADFSERCPNYWKPKEERKSDGKQAD